MPYILSPMIDPTIPGLWGEGNPYRSEVIYELGNPNHPPANYSSHTFKPHSIPHVDAPAHILPDGATLDKFFEPNLSPSFYGKAVLVKLDPPHWQELEGGQKLWRVTEQELRQNLIRLGIEGIPEKVFVSAKNVPINSHGFHDPNFILVLTEEAARWLVSSPAFNGYGTSWKSSDFEPGSRERPIHKILLKQALLFECLKLDHVPEGEYLFFGFPLPLRGASESPLVGILVESEAS